eukprot:CAMPEP_0175107062 /NCGR_PEP_ID=MMETSP0086_2-20121207/11634_1 /TAXON_ID=136419 /ORGANISM="Unknown Unknown, Strain D1" /LENGTH=118 /DNA_ID=CAMNT_0016383643 /DNA_START=269 /DNA_END=622 /DNA_ORIENTATION=+
MPCIQRLSVFLTLSKQNMLACVMVVGGLLAAEAGWCDSSPQFKQEWSDEFDGSILDTSKWSVVCSHPNASSNENCDVSPFPTHAGDPGGAECRTAECIAEAVSVADGHLILTSQRDAQ